MTLQVDSVNLELTEFYDDVVSGLSKKQKQIPSKYFYDHRGSFLFEKICELPEYYITRTEMEIFRSNLKDIVEFIGKDTRMLEFGSGSSMKTKLLLSELNDLKAYYPLDISEDHLMQSSQELNNDFPELNIIPLHRDYMADWELPVSEDINSKLLYFYPGSTIGNFEPADAVEFINKMRNHCEPGDKLLIGVDLIKDHNVIHAAYNDAQSVTADFNRNLLHRMKAELGAKLDMDAFDHFAPFNDYHSRVEMRLVANQKTKITLNKEEFHFDKDEYISTEYCYKYFPEDFAMMVMNCGFKPDKVWMDENSHFGLFGFIAE